MTTINKTHWPDGPWKTEPDELRWTDEATGLPCLIKRHPTMGHLCGYVGFGATQDPFGVHYDNIARRDDTDHYIDVHGGLTFAGFIDNKKTWWVGFDCAHWTDFTPGSFLGNIPRESYSYRDLEYVKAECARLAKQLTP